MPCDMEGVELAEVAVPLPMDIAVGASCPSPLVMSIAAWQALLVVQPEQAEHAHLLMLQFYRISGMSRHHRTAFHLPSLCYYAVHQSHVPFLLAIQGS